MLKFIHITAIGAALSLAACSGADPQSGQNSSAAKKADAAMQTEKTPMAALPIPAGAYDIDKTHGYVTFSYSHMGLSNPQIRYRDIDAFITLDPAAPENSALSVKIDAASVDTGVDAFDEHLNSEGWMNTAVHKTITFNSTKMVRTSADRGTVTGDLTIMDITKPVVLDVKLLGAKEHPFKKVPAFGIEARGTLKRSDFGLGKYAPAVSDEVSLLISAEFHKRK